MLKAILFDVDGVLVDSFESNFQFFQEVFKISGYPSITRAKYKRAFHLTMMDVLKFHLPDAKEVELKKLAKIGFKLFRQRETPKVVTGSTKVVKSLAKKYKLGLVTGRTKEGVVEYLDHVKLDRVFKVKSYFGLYKYPKPHPEPILYALKKLKIKASEAVYIGDTVADIEAASAAGIKIILFNKRRIRGADVRIDSFDSLPKAIEKISKVLLSSKYV